jgi:methanogenic corrinoid protein MtbC1
MGFDTIHLGANTPQSGIIETIKTNDVNLMGVSVTLPIHLKELDQLVTLIRGDDETKGISIMVGGYVFNQKPNFWKDFAVDGYSA